MTSIWSESGKTEERIGRLRRGAKSTSWTTHALCGVYHWRHHRHRSWRNKCIGRFFRSFLSSPFLECTWSRRPHCTSLCLQLFQGCSLGPLCRLFIFLVWKTSMSPWWFRIIPAILVIQFNDSGNNYYVAQVACVCQINCLPAVSASD